MSFLLNHWVELTYWGVILLIQYKERNKEIISNSWISLLYMTTSQILLLFPSHLGRSVKHLLTKVIFENIRTTFIVCAEINHQTYSQQSSSHSIFTSVPGRGSGDEGQYIHALALLKLWLHQQFIGIFPYLSPLLRDDDHKSVMHQGFFRSARWDDLQLIWHHWNTLQSPTLKKVSFKRSEPFLWQWLH